MPFEWQHIASDGLGGIGLGYVRELWWLTETTRGRVIKAYVLKLAGETGYHGCADLCQIGPIDSLEDCQAAVLAIVRMTPTNKEDGHG